MIEKHIAKINEIFDSIQGEGPYIGYRQLFVRFCGCNLLCDYCDTEFDNGQNYTAGELLDKVKTFDIEHIHSISLTGGEPLLQYEFLREFLPKIKNSDIKIYLETNGTLTRALNGIVEYLDIVSMDFKLDSSAKIGDLSAAHADFLKTVKEAGKEVFAKIVFDEKIRDFEIDECEKKKKKYDIPLILQPKMEGNKISVLHDKILEVFRLFTEKYNNVRLIGQVHKFFDIK